MLRNIVGGAVFGVVALCLPVVAQAQVYTESVDAGVTPATAAVLPQGTTSVQGTLVNGLDSDVDLYRFELLAPAAFTIEVKSTDFDANLIVFNAAGQGLAGDDDDNSSCTPVTTLDYLNSCLTLNLAAGTYYFGVGDNNMAAFASEGDYLSATSFIENGTGILGAPTGAALGRIGAEGGPTSIENEGAYVVNFSQAVGAAAAEVRAVPLLPFGLVLLLGGVMAMFGMRRLRA